MYNLFPVYVTVHEKLLGHDVNVGLPCHFYHRLSIEVHRPYRLFNLSCPWYNRHVLEMQRIVIQKTEGFFEGLEVVNLRKLKGTRFLE